MTEIHAVPSSSGKTNSGEDKPSTSGVHKLADSGANGAPAVKKHAADKLLEKKRKEKKRVLKRL